MLTKFVRAAFRIPVSRYMSAAAAKLDPVQIALLDETCILVDEHDKAYGGLSKRNCHAIKSNEKLPLHRAFSVFLFNSRNELLLQKRSPYKITYPNCYTNTCCSHPLWSIIGEREEKDALGVRRAAQRRLGIELGIPPELARPEHMQYITRIHYADYEDGKWGEHEIDYILFLKADVKLDINPNEISEVQYLALDNLDEFVTKNNPPLTPWFRMITKSGELQHWWQHVDNQEAIVDHKNIINYVM